MFDCTPIFKFILVILLIRDIHMKIRCLLSTVLVVPSTDIEMLFSVAGFQTSTVKRKNVCIYNLYMRLGT